MSRIDAILAQSNLSREELLHALELGASVVRYPYVISVLLVSLKLDSSAVLIKRASQRYVYAIPYLLGTLALGWWGVPWGPMFTVKAVWCLIQGGEEITNAIHEELQSSVDYTT